MAWPITRRYSAVPPSRRPAFKYWRSLRPLYAKPSGDYRTHLVAVYSHSRTYGPSYNLQLRKRLRYGRLESFWDTVGFVIATDVCLPMLRFPIRLYKQDVNENIRYYQCEPAAIFCCWKSERYLIMLPYITYATYPERSVSSGLPR